MKSTGVLLLLIACLLTVGCTSKDKQDAVNLDNRAVEICAALTSAGVPFASHMNKWMDGERTDVAALKSALASIEPLPGKFRGEFEKLPYPENQYAVTAYRTSMLNYLDGQQKLVESLKVVVEKAALHNPGDEALRREVAAEFRGFEATQKKTLNDLNLKRERLNSFLME
ncbi:hypothetical protein DES53_11136 [Roseimicrobium gellanilyticum]|uniref:Lipoprotein n=1 Tax=Roseimicrobium gellanilyticum TaxID=748857 RepID=A0A366H8G9_9BACT|nr:hypothetical protein [Roseimicrobium gellanilyticum]RBP38518.1 hypothetical protein DES53_11136 [Roseimicrobium gellanilyticum]